MSSQESSEEEDSGHNFGAEDEVPSERAVEPDTIVDPTSKQQPGPKKGEQIRKYLEDDRQRFIDHIFKGGEQAYEQALEDIAEKDDWRSASQFIHRQIFKRNLVDMYSETAVNFTDRLHNYFMKETKSN